MTEALPAALLVIAVALGVLKYSEVASNPFKKPVKVRRPKKIELSDPDADRVAQYIRAFDQAYADGEARGFRERDVRTIQEARTKVLTEMYGRSRFLPNDELLHKRAEDAIREADRHMTSAIERARRLSPSEHLRHSRGPLACGDGDAMLI